MPREHAEQHLIFSMWPNVVLPQVPNLHLFCLAQALSAWGPNIATPVFTPMAQLEPKAYPRAEIWVLACTLAPMSKENGQNGLKFL